MQLHRQDIVDLLQEDGDMGTAHRAEATLPEHFDSDEYQDTLNELGIDVEYLLSHR